MAQQLDSRHNVIGDRTSRRIRNHNINRRHGEANGKQLPPTIQVRLMVIMGDINLQSMQWTVQRVAARRRQRRPCTAVVASQCVGRCMPNNATRLCGDMY
jgi:hypothetical protein